VDTENEFEPGTPAPLFQTNPREQVATTEQVVYAVSRDGQRFLVSTKYDHSSAHPMSVILNWQTEIKKEPCVPRQTEANQLLAEASQKRASRNLLLIRRHESDWF
jgi:hypothetical protein